MSAQSSLFSRVMNARKYITVGAKGQAYCSYHTLGRQCLPSKPLGKILVQIETICRKSPVGLSLAIQLPMMAIEIQGKKAIVLFLFMLVFPLAHGHCSNCIAHNIRGAAAHVEQVIYSKKQQQTRLRDSE